MHALLARARPPLCALTLLAWHVPPARRAEGNIPPGNMPGETKWQSRSVQRATKQEIRLTAGKAINVPMEKMIDAVVKDNKIVAFVKGTRQQPQCGFSFKMLNLLNTIKADYEVVNVLDEHHNPGLRDAIKNYSQWPTIPQLYIKVRGCVCRTRTRMLACLWLQGLGHTRALRNAAGGSQVALA